MKVNQYKAGAVLSYGAVAFNTVAGLIYTPWMISCIGADDYGLYTLALSVVNCFLLDFGLGDSVSRFLSKYYAEGKEDAVGMFLGIVYKTYIAITCLIAVALVVVFFNIDGLYSGLTPEQMPVFKTLFVIVAFYSIFSFPFAPLNGILTANERFVALNACNLIQKVLTVLLIVVTLLMGWGVVALVIVNAAVSVVTTLAKLVLVHRGTKARADLAGWDSGLAREVVGFSVWVMVGQVCQRFIFAVMPSIIAITATTSEVALFGLASSLESYVYTVASALNGMFMPKVSRAVVGVGEGLQTLMVRFGRVQLYIIGFIEVCFFGLGGWFIQCWMGNGYDGLWLCTLLLIIPSLIELPQLVGVTAITAAGQVRAKAFVFLAMAACNVVLGFVLSVPLGALGGCLSICIAYFLRTVGQNVIYRNSLGIDLKSFFADTFGSWLLPAAVTLGVSIVLDRLFPVRGWSGLLLAGCLTAAVYSFLCWKLSMNEYERGLVISVASKSKRARTR